MTSTCMQKLLVETGFTQKQLLKTLGLNNFDNKYISNSIAKLDSTMEACVLNEIDCFVNKTQRNIILIRYVSDHDFALYEADLFNIFKCCIIHKALIKRTIRAIERVGGEVVVVFMDSN